MDDTNHSSKGLEAMQDRNGIARYLAEARGSYRSGYFSDAKQHMEIALELYSRTVNLEPPLSVMLMYGNILEKGGQLKQALSIFHDQYIKHGAVFAFIRLGYISIHLRDLSLLKQYEDTYVDRLYAPSVSINEKLHFQVILGYYYTYIGQQTTLVHEMVEFHKVNSALLREQIKVDDYIRWVYHLHILQLLNHFTWNERAHLIYEAESLAEQNQQTSLLMNIYNLMGIGLLEENVNEAKEYMLRSKDLAIRLGNKQHEMATYSNLFMFYQYLGDTGHALELAEKAKALGNAIHSNFNDINLVKLYFLIEDYPQASKLLEEIKPKVRRLNLTITRVDALVFQYKIILRQKNEKRAKRLWPFIEKMCRRHKSDLDLSILKCQYYALLKEYTKVIPIATSCLEEKNVTVEDRIEISMILLQSYIELGQDEAFMTLVQSLESLVYQKGYFGYLSYVYYYKGQFYLKNKTYIQARVYFIRAKSYFTKINNLLKQKEIEKTIETIDQLLVEIPSNKQLEMMNLLTYNEIMFDSIRLVHSAKHLDDICISITKVLHENMKVDEIYFHFILDQKREKTVSINDKLQREELKSELVDAAYRKVLLEKSVSHFELNGCYFHGFPVFSSEKEVVSILLIKNQTALEGGSLYYLEAYLQLISPKIENVIFHELVHVDVLTNLYNRTFFMKRLKEEFQKTADYQNDLSFIMIDIDNFSYVNNQFGHVEGDHTLERVAKAIQQSVRSGDIVGRYGGEELIVILPNTYSDVARGVAHRILNEIRKIHVNDTYQITASLGVSSVDKDSIRTYMELIERADIAERYVKMHGKDGVCCSWEMEIG
jgi:diguanylate cyclase (GGDEF)-like protein